MLKEKLEELKHALVAFSSKLKQTLKQKDDNLTKTTQEKNESVRKLETSLKEEAAPGAAGGGPRAPPGENKQVLEELLKEFRELGESLN